MKPPAAAVVTEAVSAAADTVGFRVDHSRLDTRLWCRWR